MSQSIEEKILIINHLQYNHFPPVHIAFADAAIKAIDYGIQAITESDYIYLREKITMPNGVVKTAGEIIEQLHLQDFIEMRGYGEAN